jgi:hypothetical protein
LKRIEPWGPGNTIAANGRRRNRSIRGGIPRAIGGDLIKDIVWEYDEKNGLALKKKKRMTPSDEKL